MTSPTNNRRRFTLLLLVAIAISTNVFSQSRLFVGIHTTPTYFSNFRKYENNTYEFYYGLNRKQFYLTNGLSIEYKFDKKLSVLFNPGIFKRRFNNDCVDVNNGTLGPVFFISKDNNCLFSVESSFNFLRMPLMLKIALNRLSKINTYIAFGNSITYCYKSINSLKKYRSLIETFFLIRSKRMYIKVKGKYRLMAVRRSVNSPENGVYTDFHLLGKNPGKLITGLNCGPKAILEKEKEIRS